MNMVSNGASTQESEESTASVNISYDSSTINIIDDHDKKANTVPPIDTDDRSIDEDPIEDNSEENLFQILDLDTILKLQEKENNYKKTFSTLEYFNILKQSLTKGTPLSDFEKIVLSKEPNDCSLVAKYSKLESFRLTEHKFIKEIILSTLQINHPLRVYHERNTEDIESKEALQFISQLDSLPVIVFIHGLGGQMSQFEPVMALFSQCADIFSLDLPGFGNSKPTEGKTTTYNQLSKFDESLFAKMQDIIESLPWSSFTTSSIVDLIYEVLLIKFPNRRFIFVGHSMGTHITTKLINKFEKEVESFVILCPPSFVTNDSSIKATSLKSSLPLQQRLFFSLSNLVPSVFDYYRYCDRVGGLFSKSVESYIFVDGASSQGDPHLIFKRLRQLRWNLDTSTKIFLKYLNGFERATSDELLNAIDKLPKDQFSRFMVIGAENDKVTSIKYCESVSQLAKHKNITYKRIKNANHSIFLDKPELTSGLILQFIDAIKPLNISIPWCLQVKALINGDKWGMKNLLKWSKIKAVSSSIVNPSTNQESPLLGMKTLRESDEVHNPSKFEESHPEVYAIINIGSDLPSYNTENFKRIKYVKFPTVSKIIPDNVTVRKFTALVDDLLINRTDSYQKIVVHCHYGFNRTGFLICCYNIEKLKWSVSDSVEAFKIAKEPGIKHPHFIDGLYIRYEK